MSAFYWSDELYHHGILGQKWGVRRYQNADGTLTEAGRKRYLSPEGREKGYNKLQEAYFKVARKKGELAADDYYRHLDKHTASHFRNEFEKRVAKSSNYELKSGYKDAKKKAGRFLANKKDKENYEKIKKDVYKYHDDLMAEFMGESWEKIYSMPKSKRDWYAVYVADLLGYIG